MSRPKSGAGSKQQQLNSFGMAANESTARKQTEMLW
jgi:hypothetical protein